MPLYCPSTTGMANDTTCPRLLTILPLVLMIRIASSLTSGGTTQMQVTLFIGGIIIYYAVFNSTKTVLKK